MKRVAIIDYGMCNLDSIARAVEECGGNPLVTSAPKEALSCERVIVPGVGAFPDAMRNLKREGMDDALRELALTQELPVLGICLGMQLLASRGTEVEDTEGLGLVEGVVKRLVPSKGDERVPHIGWNEVTATRAHSLFDKVRPGADFYFVHSFAFACAREEDVLATTPYCGSFASAVGKGNVFGVQFHPEKSQKAGFALLRNFLAY